MNDRTLLIRADAGPGIGIGHVMRCLALAQAWQDAGGNATLLTRCESPAVRERMRDEGLRVIELAYAHPHPGDLAQTMALARKAAWIVLDGYHLDPGYQRALHKAGPGLLIVDDRAHHAEYHADILLNQNMHASGLSYKTGPGTILLLGPDYALLRREFLSSRRGDRNYPSKLRHILVTLGGADPGNVTPMVIEALSLLDHANIEARVVLGPASQHRDKVRHTAGQARFPLEILDGSADMAALMAWADMAVASAGSTCWELAFMGIPTLAVTIVENQDGIGRELAAAGAALHSGRAVDLNATDLARDIRALRSDPGLAMRMSHRAREIVDGRGASRVIDLMTLEGRS